MGALVPIITVILLIVILGGTSEVDLGLLQTLPDDPSFSAEATITIDDDAIASVDLRYPEDGMIFVHAQAYGTAMITVTDGDETVQYTLEVYKEKGAAQIKITPIR